MEKGIKNDAKFALMERQEGLSRRKFLASTGGAGAALASGYLATNFLRGEAEAVAAENKDISLPLASNVGHKKYPHLLSPIRIGNHVLRNRIIGTASSPHTMVGPEPYPNDTLIAYYGNKARAGASIIVVCQPFGINVENDYDVLANGDVPNALNPNRVEGGNHTPTWDLANAGTQNLLSDLTEGVHLHDSIVLWKHKLKNPPGYDVSAGEAPSYPGGGPAQKNKEIPEEKIQEYIDNIALQAMLAKQSGFDGMYVHMGYRGPITARFLSPVTNKRKDKYGGSLENRARFCLELIDAIKKRCGEDYFLWGVISGEEHTQKGGFSLDDGAEYAKLFTGHLDMLSLKGDGENSPLYFDTNRTPFLYMTEHYKKRGVKIPLLSDGGFTNFELAEKAIASGKTDMVGMTRAFVTNPDLITFAYEGRNEDLKPCQRCNACHGWGPFTSYKSLCAVNPIWGWEYKIDQMIAPPMDRKKVAVIGGGPAGMEAAMIAARRGHPVTLYEKTGNLGGILKLVENVSFKWPQKDLVNYYARQLDKTGVKVLLNTEADPAMVKKGGYDAVIVAIGGEPIVPDIAGVKGKNVFFVTDVYGKEDSLAKDVVIIGGGERGCDTAMHLEEKGHRVTVLEAGKVLAPTAQHVHRSSVWNEVWKNHKNCTGILEARCNGITSNGVTYIDADGKQQSVKAGSVVLAVGFKPRADLAYRFHESAYRLHVVGDCKRPWDLQTSIRSAFNAASTL